MSNATVMRAKDFLNTLGVNTHIPYTDGGYANLANVESDLAYLGISKVRDSLSNGYAGSAPLSSYISLAQRGVTFDVVLFVGGDHTTQDVAASLVLAQTLDKAVPHSVAAVEGANEVNNFALTYNGVGGIAGAVALQKAIYATVKADALLPGVSVYYFTGYNAGSIGVGPNPATTPGLADADTQHPYPNNGQAPLAWVNRSQALGNEKPATGPAVYTETGYSTNGGTSGAVNQDVQAKYTLDLLMDDARNGISTTYLYQLMDAYAAGSSQGDDGFGLFGTSNQPKEAATAIHDLTTILADSGSKAATFNLAPLTYTLTHLPATGYSLELQKSSGATDIVVWNEPQIWNETKGQEVTAATVQTTVALGKAYATVKVFDPLISANAIQTLHNVSSLTLALTDHPLIVEVEPQASTVSGGSGSTTTTTPSGAGAGTGAVSVASATTAPVVTAASVTAVTTTSAQGQSVPAFTFPGGTVAAGALAQAQYAALFDAHTVSFAGSGAIPAPGSAGTALVVTTASAGTVPAGYAAVLDDATGDRLAAAGGITAFLQNDTNFSAGAGSSTVYAVGSDTVSAGSGALTVLGGAGRLMVAGGSGALSLVGGSGSVSVTGGSGATVLTGSTGAGSTVLQGGSGNNTLTGGSGTGASTLIGGHNVTEFTAGSGPTMMVAGTGSSIMNGTTGTGAETVFTAGGQALIALNNAADTMVGGSGASTIIGGGGATIYAFLNGHAGGSEVILGFSGHDNLAFGGFGGWAISNETVVSGSDVMRLTDGTEITFIGLPHRLF